MVDMEVTDEDSLEAREVETGLGEREGRPPAVDDEDAPSTTRAEAIPARPATGIGAPAVPRRTNSVVMESPVHTAIEGRPESRLFRKARGYWVRPDTVGGGLDAVHRRGRSGRASRCGPTARPTSCHGLRLRAFGFETCV